MKRVVGLHALGSLGRLKHHRTRAIAEKNRNRAVIPIDRTRHDLAADDQGLLAGMRHHPATAQLQRIDETRARRGKIEGAGIVATERGLDEAARRREGAVVGRRSRAKDHANLFGLRTRGLEGLLRRLRSKRRGGLIRCRPMARMNARMGENPLV